MYRFLGCLLLCLTVSLVGCSTQVTKENYNQIRRGMTRDEVIELLGEPTRSYQGITTWRGNSPSQTITIVFDHNDLVSEKNADGL